MEEFLIRGWDRIPPGWRWALAVRTPAWGFHTVRGGIDPGVNHVRPQYVGVVDVWKDLPFEECTLSSPGVAGPANWGFHTVRDAIDSRDHRFRPRLVEFVDVWKDS